MYLYIFENGDVAKSDDPPIKHDLECIGAGILGVFKVSNDNIYRVSPKGGLGDVGEAVLDTVEGTTFHTNRY